MKPRLVHAFMAAGVENPSLLQLWQGEPDLLRSYGVDPDGLDFEAMRKFAGFTAKVRHNGLRGSLPLTFRFLNVTGLEIELFSSYALFRASEGSAFSETTEARTRDLVSFLEQWVDPDRREHAMLWDLGRYELALSQLSKQVRAVRSLPATKARSRSLPSAAGVPRVCGQIILHEMRSDPRTIASRLQEKSPSLEGISFGTFQFCFWSGSEGGEINIIELDELGFYILTLADGKRSTSDLSRLMGGKSRPARGLLKALKELAGIGIIVFDTAPGQAQ
jgi:hypothetical protein